MSSPRARLAGMRRRQALGLALLVLLVIGFGAFLMLGRHGLTLWRHGMRLKGLAQNPAAVLEREEPAAIEADLVAIGSALRGLHVQVGPLLSHAWLPWRAGRDTLRAGDVVLRVGAELAEAGQVAARGLQRIVGSLPDRDDPDAGETGGLSEALYRGLVAARPHFVEAAPAVWAAADDLEELSTKHLLSPLPGLLPKACALLRLGAQALEAGSVYPVLLGEDAEANYLLLAQNSDELRATGGFISGIGVVTLHEGRIGDLAIRDSYDYDRFTVEHPWPPEPMTRYMRIDQWATRDGNWWPDYPTSARAVEDLYHLENSTTLQGIVAFDMLALPIILRAVGPLYLERYQDHITADNVLSKVREYWGPSPPPGMELEEWLKEKGWYNIKREWWADRKEFMGVLAKALLQKAQADAQPDKLNALLFAVKRAMEEKHLFVYFPEPPAQQLLELAGVDGAQLRPQNSDYLLVLDTNMGYNKVNVNVSQGISYQATLIPGVGVNARLTVTYQNRSPAQAVCKQGGRIEPTYELMTRDCYWNYLRVYVPAGSELLGSEGVTDTESYVGEQGHTVFATFFVLPASESMTLSFDYRVPLDPAGEYQLLAQKQPGTGAVPLEVRFTLPEGFAVSQTGAGARSGGNRAVSFKSSLSVDQRFAVGYRQE